jgi:hypothetical protein
MSLQANGGSDLITLLTQSVGLPAKKHSADLQRNGDFARMVIMSHRFCKFSNDTWVAVTSLGRNESSVEIRPDRVEGNSCNWVVEHGYLT